MNPAWDSRAANATTPEFEPLTESSTIVVNDFSAVPPASRGMDMDTALGLSSPLTKSSLDEVGMV